MKKFFKKLIESDSKESSKRALAIWFSVILTIIILYLSFCDKVDGMDIVWAIIGLVLTLLGLTTYQAAQKNYSENKTKRTLKQNKSKTDAD